ncbi:hypothetical protein [Mycolicibacterium fortuitum]|uniref:hypothetical protein n=1 Tax=Mycolicibacterium fortuitum TaxID=1766 RepID=UPI00148FC0DD|nr:hypothetical protein [Mycolicibacterium fortuitum]
MNVAQLRKAIANLPDNMPVVTDRECGIEHEPNIAIVPAHRDKYGWIGEEHVNTESPIYQGHANIHALHIGNPYGDDIEDITPDQPPSVIDAEVIQPELPGGTA